MIIKNESKFKKFLTGRLLVVLAIWSLIHFTDVHAGQTYYYDSKGNRISAEEYQELVDRLNRRQNQPAAAEGQSRNQKAAQQERDEDDPAAEQQNDDEDLEADDIESFYQVEFSSETIFRAFERDTDSEDDALVVPGYQYLRFDLGALDEGGLSMHMYGWGRYDFNDSGFYDDNPDSELLYGYLEYNRPDYGLNLTLGRQHVMTGIINNSIDGLGIKSALTPYFNFALYGGSPVGLSSREGRSGDSIWGGRVAGHKAAEYEIGFSYKKKKSDGDDDEEMAGVDLFAQLPLNINLFGFSSYNLDTRGWGEHSYEIRFDVYDFYFRPFYQRFQYEDFFNKKDNSANPFRFLADTGVNLSLLGTDVVWQHYDRFGLGAKLNYYNYDHRDDDAFYFEGNATWKISGLTQIGGHLGRMNGGSDKTRYSLARAFFYWDRPAILARLGFITGDVMCVIYDAFRYGQDYSLWFSLGSGVRLFDDAMEVKLSGDWSDDPYESMDLRAMLKVEYNY